MSKKAWWSTHFTSHCIRATSVTILTTAGPKNSRLRSVTGHQRDGLIESSHERPRIQQQVQSSAIFSNFVVPVQASQAITVQNTAQQSRSPLETLKQNQSQDEIRCFNQQSNVGAQQTNAPENFSSGTFQFLWTVLPKKTSEK